MVYPAEQRINILLLLLLLLSLLLSLSEVLSPKGRPIKTNPQAKRDSNPDSQAALRRMLSVWARV